MTQVPQAGRGVARDIESPEDHMATEKKLVDPNAFGGGGPKLEQSDLEADVAVLTIAQYDEMDVDDSDTGATRRTACLRFTETGDRALWLNKTAIKTLVEKLGNDAAAWTGAKVPVEKVTRQFRGQRFPKVDIVPAEEWDDYLKPQRKRGKR
jgi:hypothetical protein